MRDYMEIVGAAIFVWIVRLVFALPFLDSENRLPGELTEDGRLTTTIEFFFSGLMLALVFATGVAALWLFRKSRGDAIAFGVKAGAIMTLVLAVIDLVLAVGLGSRTLGTWVTHQLPDLTPVLLIPIFVGIALQRSSTEPKKS